LLLRMEPTMAEEMEESSGASLTISEEDISTTKAIFEEISHRAKDCCALVAALTEKVKRKEMSTAKGISFLEMKNHLLLQYLLGLGGVVMTKVAGKSLKDNCFVDQLVELRVVLEKIRPIDHKLKYQIDKLIRNASDAQPGSDPLVHKANLDNLNEDDSDVEDQERPTSSKKDVYQPPKVSSTPYEDEEETPAKQMDKVRKKSINRQLIRELQEEFLDTPTEIFNKGEGFSSENLSRHTRDKQRYEETYLTRLPETKKEKHMAKAISTMGILGDEITDFKPRRSGTGGAGKKSLKRKKAATSGSKKRFRKK